MESWMTRLLVNDLYDKHDTGLIDTSEMALTVAHRLSLNPFAVDPELQRVINDFKQAKTALEFNAAMHRLCDYADVDCRILVERRGPAELRSN
jgi:hypothetical protein